MVVDKPVRVIRKGDEVSVTNLGNEFYWVDAQDKAGNYSHSASRVNPGNTLTLRGGDHHKISVYTMYGDLIRTTTLANADPEWLTRLERHAIIPPAVTVFTDPPFLIHNGSMRSIYAESLKTKHGTELSLQTGATTFTIRCPKALNIEVHPDGNITLRVSEQEKA